MEGQQLVSAFGSQNSKLFILQFKNYESKTTVIFVNQMTHEVTRKVPKKCHILFEWLFIY